MTELEDLEALYAYAAPHSDHKRGDHVNYLRAEDLPSSGEIVWIQAAYQAIPIKYIIAPDDNGFLDFALPSDILTQDEQEPALHDCPYCSGAHYGVEACPLKPRV
jgi:hypothetical protein